jgi:AraC-like DNA-binding protein/ABC-type Fe3+-citrate transport system substrate-binding protein
MKEADRLMFPDTCYVPLALIRLCRGEEKASFDHHEASYMLLAAELGRTGVRIGKRRVWLMPGECLLLAYADSIEAECDEQDNDWLLYALQFQAAHVPNRSHDADPIASLLPLSAGNQAMRANPRLLKLLGRMYEHRHPTKEAERHRNYIRFQELIGLLFDESSTGTLTSKEAVERTIAQLHETYDEELTLQLLAERAALSPRQYCKLFRELTGTSPMDYLTDIRIAKARELLLLSEDRLPDISRTVGYRDPSYFSRRFKRSTGITPQAYVRQYRLEGRIVALQYSGHLLLLGIRPIGVGSLGQTHYFRHRLDGVGEVGLFPDQKALAPFSPDLILGFLEGERHDSLSRIAPTLTVPWERYTWREALMRLGSFFGRERFVDDWLAEIEQKAERAGKELGQRIGSEETVALVRIWKDEIHVYRKHPALYGLLRLNPPEQIARELQMKLSGFKSYIAPHQLPDYAADRVLLIVSDDAESLYHMKQLMQSPYWTVLPAVRNSRVSILDAKRWIPCDPLSIDAQLDEAVALSM